VILTKDLLDDCPTNALVVDTYGTIFANNNGFGNGATIGNVFTVNLSTNMDAIKMIGWLFEIMRNFGKS
jgi:hypothetical protein